MKYREVTEATFLDRPNRFIAHVQLKDGNDALAESVESSDQSEDCLVESEAEAQVAQGLMKNSQGGKIETVHVKNTGRCRELLIPGVTVILEKSDNPKRKTLYDLVAVYKESLGLINMDSQAPNAAVKEWLQDPANALFPNITYLKPEYTYGDSRVDFYLEQGDIKTLIEVKGVTLEREGIGYFPDAPTERGAKHIRELMKAVDEGYEAYLAFVIQMPGIDTVLPNDGTDPAFGKALREAHAAGVKILYLMCEMTPDSMRIIESRVE